MKKMRFAVLAALVGMVAMILSASQALATATATERDTPTRDGNYIVLTQGSNTVYAGAMVCVDSAGLVEHATDAASKKVIGRAEVTQDNTGSSYSATRTIRVRRGIFRWVNGDSFTDANIGDLAYVEDNQTVQTGASASQDIIAGVIVDVDSDGVWVDTHDIGSQGAGSVTTLAASGAATLGSTLSVAGTATLSGAASVGTTLNVAGAGTMSNNLTVAKNIVSTPLSYALTAGNNTITVTNGVYVLEPAGVATVALANASAVGYGVTLINNAATNVVIVETGNIHSAGNVTLGQYDAITFRAAAVDSWIQTSATDN